MRQLRCIIAAVIAVGCIHAPVFSQNQFTEKKKELRSSEATTDTKETAKTTGTSLHQKKEQYQKRAEEKLHRFEDNVKRLYVRAEKNGVKAREKISGVADELIKKGESAKKKLKDLKEAGEGKWEHVRAELDAMLKDLERSYQRTIAKFKD